MTLRPNVDLGEFLRAVQTCREDVIFETAEGDRLNLSSTLSQFVFAAVLAGQLEAPGGQVLCSDGDRAALSPFLID